MYCLIWVVLSFFYVSSLELVSLSPPSFLKKQMTELQSLSNEDEQRDVFSFTESETSDQVNLIQNDMLAEYHQGQYEEGEESIEPDFLLGINSWNYMRLDDQAIHRNAKHTVRKKNKDIRFIVFTIIMIVLAIILFVSVSLILHVLRFAIQVPNMADITRRLEPISLIQNRVQGGGSIRWTIPFVSNIQYNISDKTLVIPEGESLSVMLEGQSIELSSGTYYLSMDPTVYYKNEIMVTQDLLENTFSDGYQAESKVFFVYSEGAYLEPASYSIEKEKVVFYTNVYTESPQDAFTEPIQELPFQFSLSKQEYKIDSLLGEEEVQVPLYHQGIVNVEEDVQQAGVYVFTSKEKFYYSLGGTNWQLANLNNKGEYVYQVSLSKNTEESNWKIDADTFAQEGSNVWVKTKEQILGVDGIQNTVISQDQSFIMALDNESHIHIFQWDVSLEEYRALQELTNFENIRDIQISANGNRLVVVSNDVQVLNWGEENQEFEYYETISQNGQDVKDITMNATGERIVLLERGTDSTERVKLWVWGSSPEEYGSPFKVWTNSIEEGEEGVYNQIAIDQKGDILAFFRYDNQIKIFKQGIDKVYHQLQSLSETNAPNKTLQNISFSQTGRQLICVYDVLGKNEQIVQVRMWDQEGVNIGEVRTLFPKGNFSNETLNFHAHSTLGVQVSTTGDNIVFNKNDTQLNIWDVKTLAIGNPVNGSQTPLTNSYPIKAISYGEKGDVVVVDEQGNVVVFEMSWQKKETFKEGVSLTDVEDFNFPAAYTYSAYLSKNQTALVTVSQNGLMEVFREGPQEGYQHLNYMSWLGLSGYFRAEVDDSGYLYQIGSGQVNRYHWHPEEGEYIGFGTVLYHYYGGIYSAEAVGEGRLALGVSGGQVNIWKMTIDEFHLEQTITPPVSGVVPIYIESSPSHDQLVIVYNTRDVLVMEKNAQGLYEQTQFMRLQGMPTQDNYSEVQFGSIVEKVEFSEEHSRILIIYREDKVPASASAQSKQITQPSHVVVLDKNTTTNQYELTDLIYSQKGGELLPRDESVWLKYKDIVSATIDKNGDILVFYRQSYLEKWRLSNGYYIQVEQQQFPSEHYWHEWVDGGVRTDGSYYIIDSDAYMKQVDVETTWLFQPPLSWLASSREEGAVLHMSMAVLEESEASLWGVKEGAKVLSLEQQKEGGIYFNFINGEKSVRFDLYQKEEGATWGKVDVAINDGQKHQLFLKQIEGETYLFVDSQAYKLQSNIAEEDFYTSTLVNVNYDEIYVNPQVSINQIDFYFEGQQINPFEYYREYGYDIQGEFVSQEILLQKSQVKLERDLKVQGQLLQYVSYTGSRPFLSIGLYIYLMVGLSVVSTSCLLSVLFVKLGQSLWKSRMRKAPRHHDILELNPKNIEGKVYLCLKDGDGIQKIYIDETYSESGVVFHQGQDSQEPPIEYEGRVLRYVGVHDKEKEEVIVDKSVSQLNHLVQILIASQGENELFEREGAFSYIRVPSGQIENSFVTEEQIEQELIEESSFSIQSPIGENFLEEQSEDDAISQSSEKSSSQTSIIDSEENKELSIDQESLRDEKENEQGGGDFFNRREGEPFKRVYRYSETTDSGQGSDVGDLDSGEAEEATITVACSRRSRKKGQERIFKKMTPIAGSVQMTPTSISKSSFKTKDELDSSNESLSEFDRGTLKTPVSWGSNFVLSTLVPDDSILMSKNSFEDEYSSSNESLSDLREEVSNRVESLDNNFILTGQEVTKENKSIKDLVSLSHSDLGNGLTESLGNRDKNRGELEGVVARRVKEMDSHGVKSVKFLFLNVKTGQIDQHRVCSVTHRVPRNEQVPVLRVKGCQNYVYQYAA